MKKTAKLTALLLTIAMLVQVLQLPVFAQEFPYEREMGTTAESGTIPDDYVNGVRSEKTNTLPNIVAEDTSLRDETTKHFRCEDGSYILASYGAPVHYQDDNGEWKDIDNSLTLQEAPAVYSMNADATSLNGNFVNGDSDLAVQLPQTLSENTQMSLHHQGKTISFGLQCPTSSEGQVLTDTQEAAPRMMSASAQSNTSETNYDQFMKLPNISSGVKYENVYPGTDVEYIVSSTGVKENIIVKSPQESYSYTYHIAANGLTLTLNADNSVSANDAQGSTVYMIESPYMFDAKYIDSTDVAVTLTASGNGYDLVYMPNAQWINDTNRQFPVTVDPSIILNIGSSDIFDTFVSTETNHKDHCYFRGGWIQVGRNVGTAGGVQTSNRIYIKFNMPKIPDCSIVNYADLNLCQIEYDPGTAGSSTLYTEIYEAGQEWLPVNITWNNQPTGWLSGNALDYTELKNVDNGSWYKWNITSAVKRWYEDGVNTGLAIKSSDESKYRSVKFASSETTAYNASAYPTITISYMNNIGVEDMWTNHTVDMGRAGTAYINDYNGNLTYIHNDLTKTGNRMPVSINHVWNLDRTEYGTGNYAGMKFANGWRLNVLEQFITVESSSPLYTAGYHYKYIDGDGTVKYFKKTSTANKYVYENNDKLVLTNNGSGDAFFTLSDELGNKKYYNTTGFLTKAEDTNKNIQTYTYNAAKQLQTITDPVGRTVTLIYNTDKYLTEIKDNSTSRSIFFEYQGDRLANIKYPDGKRTYFQYDSSGNGNLVKAQDVDGTNTWFTYKTITVNNIKITKNSNNTYTQTNAPLRVIYRTETAEFRSPSSTNNTPYNKYTFTYAPSQTTVKDNQGREEIMMFDSAGRTVCVRDQKNRAYYGEYNKTGNKNDTLKYQSNMQQSIVNFARNHSAERDGADWYWNAIGGATGSQSITTAEHLYGNKAFKVTSNTQTGRITYRQDMQIPNDRTYTFSAYIKTENLTTTNGGAFLAFVYQDEATKEYHAVMGEMVEQTEGWERYTVTCTIGKNHTINAGLMMGLLNAQGTVYFDGIQAEFGTVANPYNLVENTGMESKTNNVPTHWAVEGCEVTSNPPRPEDSIDGCVKEGNGTPPSGGFKMTGSPSRNKRLYQDVEVNGQAGDTLIVGAWARSNSIMHVGDGPEKSCAIVVCVEYKEPYNANGDVLAYDEFYFDSMSTDSQYLTGHVTTFAPYETVRVYLRYRSNMNKVVFDDVQLHVDSYGTKYEYDDSGRVISQKDGAGQEYKYTYTGPDLTKIEFKKDGATQTTQTYTYDSSHNVTKEVSDAGVITEYTYGAGTFGNATKVLVKNADGLLKTSSSCTYTPNYNFLSTVTDARGKTVTYSYDQNKGVLNWVKDPDGNQTNYTYDPNTDVLRFTSGATTNTGASQTVQNEYTYNNDRLESITHNGFDYNFTYDLFGRAESTKVGDQVLSANTYDSKGRLSKTVYGTETVEQSIEPVYNSLDQIVEKKYNGTSKYKWEYGTDGSVNKYLDLVNGVTYRYEYDLAGRLRRVYGNDGYKQRNLYDAKGNIYNTLYTFENNSYIKKYSNNYVYGNDNRINQVHFNQTAVDLDRTYDTLGRVTQKKYSQWGGSPFFTTSYSFLAGANGNTTGMLSAINNKGETISYTYDNRGNITAINEGSTQKAKYTYDELNQLIREDSVYLNKSVTYTYDVGGNLTAKKEYIYTTGALGTATKTINYTYGDSNWKDKLTAYDGKAITYDTMGNTKTYDGNTFEWTGRQLDSISGNGNTSTYKYNANGIRTEKTVNGVTTKYYIEGDRIVLEKVGNEERAFWYDGNGQAAAFVIYDSTGMHPYYYIRNGQGDVIGLFDANGNVVARYSYDSWGNLLSIKDGSGNDKTNDTAFVGYKNPLRYRGYYYDSETKLYYLQSRYYNPEWGRFINADAIVINGLLGSNIFVYCNNNPVVMVDPTGACPNASPASMPYSSWEQHQKYCSWCINYKEQQLSSSIWDLPSESSPALEWDEVRNQYLPDVIHRRANVYDVSAIRDAFVNAGPVIYDACQSPFFDSGVGLVIKNTVVDSTVGGVTGLTGGVISGMAGAPFTAGASIPACALFGGVSGAIVGAVGGFTSTVLSFLFD